MGEPIANIQIFRALEGTEPTQIASLNADKQSYTDKEVSNGNVYYYSFVVKTIKGKTSVETDVIGVNFK